MDRRIILVAIGIAIVFGGFFLFRREDATPQIPVQENQVKVAPGTEEKLEEVLGRSIPDDVEKVTLKDLMNKDQTAVATRNNEAGMIEFTLLADLEETGETYAVWVGSDIKNLTKLGDLVEAKGGFVFEGRKESSLEDYNHVAIFLGSEKVLEGSF